MAIKILLSIIILINIKLPLVQLFDFFLFVFLSLMIFSSKSKKFTDTILLNKKILLIILMLTLINLLIPKFHFEEAHSIFVNQKDLAVIDNFLPKKIYKEIKTQYKNFNLNKMIDSYPWGTFDEFEKESTIIKPFAFSSDSFFQKNNYSRKVSKINFNSREDLRIGQLNTLKYNVVYDKEFRRKLPYYILYEIPKIAKGSIICSKGNTYYSYTDIKTKIYNIKNLNFKKNISKECFHIKKEYEKLFFIGFSINEKDNLSIKFKNNLLLNFFEILNYFFVILVFFIFFKYIIIFKFSSESIIYVTSFLSSCLLALIRDVNLLTGLRYFRGGADGLLHNSYAQDILFHIINGEFLLALRGGENVYYFMPGLRYFGAICKIFFGDTNYGYLLLGSFLPFILYLFLKVYLNKKTALILLISFIFIPIFENMGFGFFNYIWQIARNHAETLSITLILTSLYLIINLNKKYNVNTLEIFIAIFLMSIAVIARPNFFPAVSIFFIYILLIIILQKKYFTCIVSLFAYSLIFLCLIHNLYFGESFVIFTESNVHFVFNDIFQNLNSFNKEGNIIFSQFFKWNPVYNIHRLIMLLIIIYMIIFYKQTLFTYTLFCATISQHFVLFLTHPDSRYAYLAWLLTFILFVKLEFDNKLLLKSYYNLSNVFKSFKNH